MVSLPVILGTNVTDRQSGNFQHSLKTFQTVRKVSGQSKKCSGKLSLGIVSSELCELVQHYFSNWTLYWHTSRRPDIYLSTQHPSLVILSAFSFRAKGDDWWGDSPCLAEHTQLCWKKTPLGCFERNQIGSSVFICLALAPPFAINQIVMPPCFSGFRSRYLYSSCFFHAGGGRVICDTLSLETNFTLCGSQPASEGRENICKWWTGEQVEREFSQEFVLVSKKKKKIWCD